MRSLKECYEIAKHYHMYWNPYMSEYYMCVAAHDAAEDGALTISEVDLIEQDAMSLVNALDQYSASLRYALRDVRKELRDLITIVPPSVKTEKYNLT